MVEKKIRNRTIMRQTNEIRLKPKIYRTIIRPVAQYGGECWPTTGREKRALHVMEMRILRWSIGIRLSDRIKNESIHAAMGIGKLRERRQSCNGHVQQTQEKLKMALSLAHSFQVPGKRSVGRPRRRWLDVITADLNNAGVDSGLALNRDSSKRSIYTENYQCRRRGGLLTMEFLFFRSEISK